MPSIVILSRQAICSRAFNAMITYLSEIQRECVSFKAIPLCHVYPFQPELTGALASEKFAMCMGF